MFIKLFGKHIGWQMKYKQVFNKLFINSYETILEECKTRIKEINVRLPISKNKYYYNIGRLKHIILLLLTIYHLSLHPSICGKIDSNE